MNTLPRIKCAAALSVAALAVAAAPSLAASVDPVVVNGNPTCADLGSAGLHELKVDPPKSGTYTSADGAFTVTVTISDDKKSFDFQVSDDEVIDLAYAKAGTEGGNLYDYAPAGSNADTGLVAPATGGSADGAELSHITFCYEPDKVAPPIDETGPAPEPEPEPEAPAPAPEPESPAPAPEQPAPTAAPEQPAPTAAPAAQQAPTVAVLGKVVKKKAKKAKKRKPRPRKRVVRAVRTPRFAG